MVKIVNHNLKIFVCEHHKIFKVCLTSSQIYTSKGYICIFCLSKIQWNDFHVMAIKGNLFRKLKSPSI